MNKGSCALSLCGSFPALESVLIDALIRTPQHRKETADLCSMLSLCLFKKSVLQILAASIPLDFELSETAGLCLDSSSWNLETLLGSNY